MALKQAEGDSLADVAGLNDLGEAIDGVTEGTCDGSVYVFGSLL